MTGEVAQRESSIHVESSRDIKDNVFFISGHMDFIIYRSKWYVVQKWWQRAGEIMIGGEEVEKLRRKSFREAWLWKRA